MKSLSVYQAIMNAAAHIERHPGDFQFMATDVPPACGTPGCALGWIGHFTNFRGNFMEVASRVLKLAPEPRSLLPGQPLVEWAFYNRMDELSPMLGISPWQRSAAICAETLRAYAEKYHAHEKLQERPISELVADLMARVSGERIPDEVQA